MKMTDYIASSIISSASLQVDGRISVVEQHTDVVGGVHQNVYLAASGADLNAALAVHAAALSDQLTQGEITGNLQQVLDNGSAAVVTFAFSTQGQSIIAMAQQFAALGPWEIVLLGDFLAALPEADQTSALGMTSAEIAALQAAVANVQAAQTALSAMVAPLAAALENG